MPTDSVLIQCEITHKTRNVSSRQYEQPSDVSSHCGDSTRPQRHASECEHVALLRLLVVQYTQSVDSCTRVSHRRPERHAYTVRTLTLTGEVRVEIGHVVVPGVLLLTRHRVIVVHLKRAKRGY